MFKNLMSAAGAVAIAALSAGSVSAASVTASNVIFIVDESGSMGGDQAFLKDRVVEDLDIGLSDAGITDRKYGVVGFGASTPAPRDAGPGLMGTADTKTALDNLATSGSFEDGYAAIDFALANYSFTSGAAVNFVLVTDEDRDVTFNSNLSFQSIENALTRRNILLNAVVNNRFTAGTSTALGIDSDGDGYVADGSGGFTTEGFGIAAPDSTFNTSKTDYVDLALATGGAAWDLNQIRAGGDIATSFANAFIDIKVGEISTQDPVDPGVIPLPAGGWLLLTGIGAFAALRRRRKAA